MIDANEQVEKEQVAEVRKSTNETARIARSNLIFFLIAGLYIGLLVANTDDLLLLKAGKIDLPLMQIGVPVVMFYIVAPAIFVLLHLNLLLRLCQIIGQVNLMREISYKSNNKELYIKKILEFPFDFLQLLLFSKNHSNDMEYLKWKDRLAVTRHNAAELLLLFFVVIQIAIIPLLLLLSMQMRFLAYQDDEITLWHQIILIFDLCLLFGFYLYAVNTLRDRSIKNLPFREFIYWSIFAIVLSLCITIGVFVWCVAVVPVVSDSSISLKKTPMFDPISSYVFNDWWGEDSKCEYKEEEKNIGRVYFRRYLYVKNKIISKEDPPIEIISAYIQKNENREKENEEYEKENESHEKENEKYEKAWEFVDELDLRNRSFKYGIFDFSKFKNIDLRNADFSCAKFRQAKLPGANFEGAELPGANFEGAELPGANFEGAKLPGVYFGGVELYGEKLREFQFLGANVEGAKLTKENFREVQLQGANFEGAELPGAYFNFAKLQGANFIEAKLPGAYFGRAELQDAHFGRAELPGAYFNFSILQGAIFKGAELPGAFFNFAKLQGANFTEAKLPGAFFNFAELQGANFERAELYCADFNFAELQGAKFIETKLYGAEINYALIYQERIIHKKPEDFDGIKNFDDIENSIKYGLRMLNFKNTEISEILERIKRSYKCM